METFPSLDGDSSHLGFLGDTESSTVQPSCLALLHLHCPRPAHWPASVSLNVSLIPQPLLLFSRAGLLSIVCSCCICLYNTNVPEKGKGEGPQPHNSTAMAGTKHPQWGGGSTSGYQKVTAEFKRLSTFNYDSNLLFSSSCLFRH